MWHHEVYRLPVDPELEAMGIEVRRADLALWAILGAGNHHRIDVHVPRRAPYGHLALVHDAAYLESLTQPASLARVFGLARERFPVDAVAATFRVAVGGTVAATRHLLRTGGPGLNLLGGFHHAFPDRGGGLCPVNDIAIALAVARAEGFRGQVVILDLDAHPPDGLAACLGDDPDVWIGSLSGSDWGPLPGVEELLIPDADDATYLDALRRLLDRAPRPALAFVIAGGDVLADDAMGRLGLTPDGARRRDARVAAFLGETPAVWLPGGGYHAGSWRLLAQTAGVLLGPDGRPVPPDLDPVAVQFERVGAGLDPEDLGAQADDDDDDDEWLSQAEIDAWFGIRPEGPMRLYGYYTREGIEYALYAYGVLAQLRRLGYDRFRVALDKVSAGERFRLLGWAGGQEHLLVEHVGSLERFEGHRVLYLNWLTMRHPLGRFPPGRPRLPGQDAPGLGMAREASQLFVRMIERLDLDGVLLRPAWLHTAAMAKGFAFVSVDDQAAFVALQRDLRHLPLGERSRLVAAGRVRCNGAPFRWQAPPMVAWRRPPPREPAEVVERAEALHFTLAPTPAVPPGPAPEACGPTS